MKAFGIEFANKTTRFTNNFFSASINPEMTFQQLTVEETFEFMCRFKGIADR